MSNDFNPFQEIFNRLDKIESLLISIEQQRKQFIPPTEEWFDLNGLIAYLPSNPKSQTINDWVHKKLIPFHKTPGSKTLVFLRSEINEWMKSGRRKTQHEKSEIVKNYINKKNK